MYVKGSFNITMGIMNNRVLSDQTCSEIGFAAACLLASSLLNRHDFRSFWNYMTPSPFDAGRGNAEYEVKGIFFKYACFIFYRLSVSSSPDQVKNWLK